MLGAHALGASWGILRADVQEFLVGNAGVAVDVEEVKQALTL